ncbi:hypothetical protein VSS37_04315 [Candidatus Thiothrix sp. Deng01]|uniref:Uncharacterized protein n=1 Tax=Candidatus Thiothrix phosphatis TaxID=3112415 RepID=A0ABU6CTS2_9GAMM|nr:hypothetical protein [Candidatus Thiothrix sp. Deng01]MEB4590195.1 hypothetical protein [Candidatus Thiothrix sp. Deng01]
MHLLSRFPRQAVREGEKSERLEAVDPGTAAIDPSAATVGPGAATIGPGTASARAVGPGTASARAVGPGARLGVRHSTQFQHCPTEEGAADDDLGPLVETAEEVSPPRQHRVVGCIVVSSLL